MDWNQSCISGVPKYFGDIEENSNLLGKVGEYEVQVMAISLGLAEDLIKF